jgi:hypothetical protein
MKKIKNLIVLWFIVIGFMSCVCGGDYFYQITYNDNSVEYYKYVEVRDNGFVRVIFEDSTNTKIDRYIPQSLIKCVDRIEGDMPVNLDEPVVPVDKNEIVDESEIINKPNIEIK